MHAEKLGGWELHAEDTVADFRVTSRDVDVHVCGTPASFGTARLYLLLLSLSLSLFLCRGCCSEACPPSSLSLASRCRRTRDLHGAEPPKTITKCQGCHCAHVRGLTRASIALTHTVSPFLPLVPSHSPPPSCPLKSHCLPARSPPRPRRLSTRCCRRRHRGTAITTMALGEITIPAACFTMTLATAASRLAAATDRIHTQTRNLNPHASGPTRYSPRLLSAEFRRGAFSDQRFARGSPHYLFDLRGGAQPRRPRAGPARAGAPRPCLQTNARPGRRRRRCFDRSVDASRRRADRHFLTAITAVPRVSVNSFINYLYRC